MDVQVHGKKLGLADQIFDIVSVRLPISCRFTQVSPAKNQSSTMIWTISAYPTSSLQGKSISVRTMGMDGTFLVDLALSSRVFGDLEDQDEYRPTRCLASLAQRPSTAFANRC